MTTSTFSGPLRAGTQKDGTISQGFNVGNVVLTQTFDTGNMTGRVVGTVNTQIGIIPAGAIITDIAVDQVVAAGTGTTTVAVGNASAGAQLMAAVATSAGGRFRGTATAATQLAWQTGTTADTAVGTLSAGRYVVTVSYIQK
jgi:hypothetical protein